MKRNFQQACCLIGEILNEKLLEDGSIDSSKNKIKKVNKKTDFGPFSTEEPTRYYPPKILQERIWTPSATEMGITSPSDLEEIKQGGDGTKGGYAWFTNNSSRIKLNKYEYFGNEFDDNTYYDYNSPAPYWTRTWYGTSYGFFGVGVNGERRLLQCFW